MNHKIVTICGSLRFEQAMMHAAAMLELRDNCLVIQCVYPPDKTRDLTAAEHARLGELHLRKIEISDAVFIVNVGGYIGESTREEIEYARSLHKEILYLEPPVSEKKA